MSKLKRVTAVLLAVFLFSAVLAVGTSLHYNDSSDNSSEQFRNDLTSIYSKYDTDLASASEKGEFALRRLIVSDYKGDECGAVATAVDEKNGFAVLQYETEEQAQTAYKRFKAQGYIVDADGVAQLQVYDKGEMYPTGSDAVGTASYINKCEMDTEEIVVAVIDTGMMLNHPDLKDRFISEGYDYSQDGRSNADYDPELQPYYYHGSAVCGVIANNTPDNVKILPYKVVPFGMSYTTDSAVISAINNAVDMDVDVINLSYASNSAGSSYRRAVVNASNKNICVCAGAGNSSEDCSGYYPASIPEAFTVSALNTALTGIASYSNYGATVDFCAPGTKIYSTVPEENGEAGYDSKSGTSFSTPYITALCCDLKSVNSDMSNDEVYDVLCDFCQDYGDEGFDEYYGYGLPSIGDIFYSEDGLYDYSIPQGELNVYGTVDCTEENNPWKSFAKGIKQVNLNGVDRIGSYCFSDMKKAQFSFDTAIISVGDYAFRGCDNLGEIFFDDTIEYIGEGAFENAEGLLINGYLNTAAHDYALANNIDFNAIGCKHSFIIDVNEPSGDSEGYTKYECRICGQCYFSEYIPTMIVQSGVCGDNLSFNLYNTGKLIIQGTGDMYDYSQSSAPWYENAENISIVQLQSGISGISPFAFYGCENLVEFKSDSSAFSVIDKSLYNSNGKRLICAVNGLGNVYTMPDTVEEFDATAFLPAKTINIIPNDHFTIESSIIYDEQNNIVAALPSYRNSLLSISDGIHVNAYAFILTEYPLNVRVYSADTSFGEYAIGYSYDNEFIKNNLEYYGYVEAPAYQYAIQNGFPTNPLNGGNCGDDISWYYNVAQKTLTISGSGDMTRYASKMMIPWYDYMQDMECLIIGDDISSISPYSFYNAANLREITLPASLAAPANNNYWSGANSITSVTITVGTGEMADYGTAVGSKEYTYTPWYINRDNIECFSLSADITRIGSFAFRNASFITSLVFNNCTSIAKYAFYDCENLESVTLYQKDTVFSNSSLFAYSDNEMKNENAVIYAYSDSTAKDYALKNNISFISMGCGHSRGYQLVSDHASCCYDATVNYFCKDCDESIYSEYLTAESEGHFVKAILKNTRGRDIPQADVYLDGVLCARTNAYGRFVIDNVKCELEHSLVIKKHDSIIASTTVNTNKSNRSGTLLIKYGNFINDTAVNGKDYAYAKHRGYDDLNLIDFGKITDERLSITSKYANQPKPSVTNMYIEQNPATSYRKDFYFDTATTVDYDITEVGVIYGKNMPDDFMVIENVGKMNSENLTLKAMQYDSLERTYFISYGASSAKGVLSTRLYIKYTNGVRSYICYSDVLKYAYE